MSGAPSKRTRAELKAVPRPRNTAELEVLSAWYFGKALHIGTLWVYESGGSYDVAEAYDEYHGDGWLHSKHCIRGYDYSRDFWRHVFGPLGTGGIARNSYGSFTIEGGHREASRLKSLQESWRQRDAGRVRKSLARLVPGYGGEENTAILGSGRVLRDDRVDGASTASPVRPKVPA